MNKLQELALAYADTEGLPGHDQSPLFQRMRSVLLEIAETKAIGWKDTQWVKPGIASRLRDNFPMTSPSGQLVMFPPHVTPDDAGSIFKEASLWSDDLAQKCVYGELFNFCISAGKILHRIARDRVAENASNSTSIDERQLARKDITIDVRKRFGTRCLCQFCWRPASQPASNTCHRHSQIDYANEHPERYMRARRHGLKTPFILKHAWDRGVIEVVGDRNLMLLVDTLRTMRDQWENSVRRGIAQGFIDGYLGGDTYKPLRSAHEYKSWGEFHAALLRAFDASPLTTPDDPVYTVTWLPYAIEEVLQERKWEASRTAISAIDVQAIRDELEGRRGWQSEAARRLGISRQRVHQIAKKAAK